MKLKIFLFGALFFLFAKLTIAQKYEYQRFVNGKINAKMIVKNVHIKQGIRANEGQVFISFEDEDYSCNTEMVNFQSKSVSKNGDIIYRQIWKEEKWVKIDKNTKKLQIYEHDMSILKEKGFYQYKRKTTRPDGKTYTLVQTFKLI